MQPKRSRFRQLAVMATSTSTVLLAALALSLDGCRPHRPGTAEPDRPYQGVVLRVACPGEPLQTIVQRYGKSWSNREGVQLKVEACSPADAPPAGADVWVVPPAELPRWAAAGRLRPVPEAYLADNHDYGWKNLLPLYRNHLLLWDHKAYALPLLGESPLCFYRADLLQSEEHRKAFRKKYGRDLGPPTTWEEFADVADYFAEARGGPSLPPLPDSDAGLDREFYAVAASFARRAVRTDEPKAKLPPDEEAFSFHLDLITGAVRIDQPGFVHALDLLKRLQRCRPPEPHPAPPEAFRDGQAVLCLADASWIGRFHQGKVGRKFGIRRVPGGDCYYDYSTGEGRLAAEVNRVPYLGSGGWLMVVPATSAQPDAAFALLAELSNRETSRQIALEPQWGGAPIRGDQLDGPFGWYGFDLGRAATHDLVESLRDTLLHPWLKNPVFRLRTPDQHACLQAVTAEVRAALLQERRAGDALRAAAKRWQQLEPDVDRRLANYRLSLGLQAER